MHWRRADPVQEVDALILTGADAPRRLAEALAGKPAAFQALKMVRGAEWAAIFAGELDGVPVLPRVAGAIALYRVAPGWWLPVGVAVEAPAHAQGALFAALGDWFGVVAPAILVPRFADGDVTDAADAYPVGAA